MRIRLKHFAIAMTLAAGALASRSALADAQSYASTRRQVRVGMVMSSALNRYNGNTSLGSENPDPHVFYILDRRSDLKPFGLDLVNPLAPPVITGSVYDRWRVRVTGTDPAFVNGTPENRSFKIGAKVTKNMGAYWEVNIDNLSAADLQQYDLLYLHSHITSISFTPEQRERLRKYVESGGTLFVENCGRMTFDNNAPFFDINFRSGSNGGASAVVANANHPLLSYPFILSSNEVQTLGDKFVNDFYLYRPDPANGNDTGPGPDIINPPAGSLMVPLVWNTRGLPAANVITPNAGWRPYIMAGSVGAGKIVFGCADVGCGINDYVGGALAGYGGNSGAISGETLSAARPNDLKFMFNLALWSTSQATANADPRRSGGSDDKIGTGALSQKWDFPNITAAARKVGAPAFFKHCVFTVDGDLIAHCFDTVPGQDLDGDGNPDEGIPDFVSGLPYDEIWRFDLKTLPGAAAATGASTPTAIEFYDPNYVGQGMPGQFVNFKQREQVIIVLSTGAVVALRAFPRLATSGFPYAPITAAEWSVTNLGMDYGIAAADPRPIPSAAWSEHVVFVGLNTPASGQVAAIDPVSGASAFDLTSPPVYGQGMVPGDPVGQRIGAVVSSPSVGYVRDQASGANDKMVYVQAQRPQAVGGAPDSIQSFPFGTKGELLTRQAGADNIFTSRSSGTFPPAPWYLVPDPNGSPGRNGYLRQRVYATYRDPATGRTYSRELVFDLAGGGITTSAYQYQYTPGQPVRIIVAPNVQFGSITRPINDTNITLFADYTLDWATLFGNAKVKTRSTIFGPQDVSGAPSILGGAPGLSSEDILYYTADTRAVETVNSGGRGVLFAVGEQGSNRTALKWAYTMHDGVRIALDNGSVTVVPPRLRIVRPDGAFAATPIGEFVYKTQYIGTPAVRNGVVYATASAYVPSLGGTDPNVSIVAAFRANPEIILRLGVEIDRNVPVQIRQVNPVTQQAAGNSAPITLPQQNYTVDYASGTVRITSMAFAGGTSGFFSTSLPFQVKVGNAPEVLIFGTQADPLVGANEGRIVGPPGVDNLVWYTVVPQAVQGKNIGLISTPPSVQSDLLYVGTQNGFILALDADPASNDPSAQAAGSHAQLLAMLPADVGHLRWMQQVGSANAAIQSAPVGTETVIAATSATGVSVYEDTRTLIADNKRIVEVNAAGEAVWTCDGTRTFGVAGGGLPVYYDPITGAPVADTNQTGVPVQQRVAWSRPQVVRRVGHNDMLVVDSGNNRVVQIDRGGNVLWEVNRLMPDMLLDTSDLSLRGMYRPGDPLTLSEPTDCLNWSEFIPNLGAWLSNMGLSAYGNQNVPGYVLHYLVADTGNFRVVEIVDVVDLSGSIVNVNTPRGSASLRRQVTYVSSSYPKQGARYRYRSLQRLVVPNRFLVPPFSDPGKGPDAQIRFTLGLVQNHRLVGNPNAGVGASINAIGQTLESGGGSIVVLNEGGDPISVVSNLRVPNGSGGYVVQPIVNPVWFSKFDEFSQSQGRPIFKYLLADANGCYQIRNAVDPMTGLQDPRYMDVEWRLTTESYHNITGKKLNASSIMRLSNAVTDPTKPGFGLHHFLITNRFSGEDNPAVFGVTFVTNPAIGNISGRSEFHGEVFQINPENFQFGAGNDGYLPDYMAAAGNYLVPNPQASIVWRTPSERLPTPTQRAGVIERYIGSTQRATSTSVLEQPAFADRPF